MKSFKYLNEQKIGNKTSKKPRYNASYKSAMLITLYQRMTKKVKQKERRVDALALRADEGRDKLRKATRRRK